MKKKMKQTVTLLMFLVIVFSSTVVASAESKGLGVTKGVLERKYWDVYAAAPYSSNATTISFTCTAVRRGEVRCTELTGANELTINSGYVEKKITSITGAGQYRYFDIPYSYVGMTVSFVMGIKSEAKPATAKGWLDY